MRRTIDLIVLIIIIFVGYNFRSEIKRGALIAGTKLGVVAPCSRPITYSIGTFDTRFGISKETFLKNLDLATKLWEIGADRDLFAYADDGTLKINLIYDYRQSSTQKLNALGNTIDNTRAGYDRLKTQYTTLQKKIAVEKTEYDALIAQFEADRSNRELFLRIKALQNTVNANVDELNALAQSLNTLARELNIKVETYNTIGATTGEEFDEGIYISDISGDRINIYQYGSQTKLERVLAHELGHALGLDHVGNAQSIMYYLNSGTSKKLSVEDAAELTKVCKL